MQKIIEKWLNCALFTTENAIISGLSSCCMTKDGPENRFCWNVLQSMISVSALLSDMQHSLHDREDWTWDSSKGIKKAWTCRCTPLHPLKQFVLLMKHLLAFECLACRLERCMVFLPMITSLIACRSPMFQKGHVETKLIVQSNQLTRRGALQFCQKEHESKITFLCVFHFTGHLNFECCIKSPPMRCA